MDTEHTWTEGEYATAHEAIAAGTRVVENSIKYEPSASAEGMYFWCTMFGDDPSVIVIPGDKGVPPRAERDLQRLDYARQRCAELAGPSAFIAFDTICPGIHPNFVLPIQN
jgi:hypothetical protein